MLSIKEKLTLLQGSNQTDDLVSKVDMDVQSNDLAQLEIIVESGVSGPVWVRRKTIPASLVPMFDLNRLTVVEPSHMVLIGKSWTLEDISPDQILFFDTETTGLSGGTGTYAFLVGVARWTESGMEVKQYFLLNQSHEYAMLQALEKDFQDAKALVSFNGKSYDIPLIKNRYIMNRLVYLCDHYPHLDLLHAARRLWKGLPGYGLTTLEQEILGFRREGDVPGNLIPELYFNAIRGGNLATLKGVFKHNVMDLISLAGLLIAGRERFVDPKPKGRDMVGVIRTMADLDLFGQAENYCQNMAGAVDADIRQLIYQQHARVLKRQKKYHQAACIWEAWINNNVGFDLEPYEELAKYYEHIQRDYAKALQVTGKAYQRLEINDQLFPGGTKSDIFFPRLQKRRWRLGQKIKQQRLNSGDNHD